MHAATLLFAAALAASASAVVPALTNAQASGGLKEALSQGISTAVAETGKPGGFENNALIRIVMPDKLKNVEKGLRTVGMGAQVDSFEHSMNAAALLSCHSRSECALSFNDGFRRTVQPANPIKLVKPPIFDYSTQTSLNKSFIALNKFAH